MYLWIAADVSEALQPLRMEAQKHNPGLNEVAFMLPQHISLKISFHVPSEICDEVIEQITTLLTNTKPITVTFKGLEQAGDILWLRADDALHNLHNQLDQLLFEHFNIPQHPLDKAFIFHSTLFIDKNQDLLQAISKKLTNYPPAVTIANYIIGISPDGTPGSYRVIKNIRIRQQFKAKRLQGFNYSTPGSYFITVCSANQRPLFWRNKQLSAIGKTVEREISKIGSTYNGVQVDKYAIMPDHLHLIITITEPNAPAIPRIIQQFKGSVTKQIGHPIWQRSYHDHIIRNQKDYNEKWLYIDNNPKKFLIKNE